MSSSKKYQIDMCSGPLFSKIIRFSIPLMLANVLGLLFYAADLVVLGRFASAEAMAAVGATNGLTVLVLNIFYGLSTGVNVLVARYIGARDPKRIYNVIQSSMALAIYGGALATVISLLLTKPMLRLMSTPAEVFSDAVLYMCICNLGIPAIAVYCFGAAIMRADGDTKRPLQYMVISGIINVLMNLFFVLVCKMDVAGVGIATKLSNVIAAVLVIRALMKNSGSTHLDIKKIFIDWPAVKEIFRIGLPAGIQGSLFSISNITIQASINSLGWQVIAGNTAASNLEGLVYVAAASYYHSALSFVGQNHGAKKYKRIVRAIFVCVGCSAVTAFIIGYLCIIFGKQLLAFYNPDPEVMQWGMVRIKVLLSTYFLCGAMEVITGCLRGLGHSVKPTIVTLVGICAFRVLWVFLIFPLKPTMFNLMISYPITWVLVISVNGFILYRVCVNMMRKAVRKHPHALYE